MTTVDDTTTDGGSPPSRGSLWHRLYHGETTYDFVGKRRIGFVVSGVLLVLTVVSLFVREVNLGIDFEGGVSWEVPSQNIDRAEIDSILAANGISSRDTKVQFLSGSGGSTVRVQVPEQDEAVRAKVAAELAQAAEVATDDVSVNNVSSTWGEEITRKAVTALVVFMLLLMVYISWRFEWKMAVAAIIAMLHDVGLSVGAYSLFQFTVAPGTVIAFLTILGYSLYDTIVVFDRVHENAKRFGTSRVGYGDIVNLSMNQVLMRSFNTTISSILPVLSVLIVGAWIMGAVVLVDFALALFVGMLAGTYSSLFVASPILAMLKGREKRYAALRDRHASGEELARLRASGAAAVTTGRAGAAPSGADSAKPAVTDPALLLQHPPRPRKKRRR